MNVIMLMIVSRSEPDHNCRKSLSFNIHLHTPFSFFLFSFIFSSQAMSSEQPATKTSRGPAEEVVAKRLKALGKKLVRH